MATINQTFDFNRFGHLFVKYFIENWRKMSIQFGGLTIVMILVLLWLQKNSAHLPSGEIFVFTGVIASIYGLFIASGMFRSLGNQPTAISTLTCPVSQFEGFLVRWTVAVPLFILWAYLSILLADWIRVVCYSSGQEVVEAADWSVLFTSTGYGLSETDFLDSIFWSFISNFLIIQSFFFLGSVVWQKNALVKTLVALFIIWMSYTLVAWIYVMICVHHDMYFGKMMDLGLISVVVRICGTLFNYLLAYMRFREAEIINRW